MKAQFRQIIVATTLGALICGPVSGSAVPGSISTAAAPAIVSTSPTPLAPPGTPPPPTRVIPPAKLNLPPELQEVVRLEQSGVDQSVILSYVQRTSLPYAVSADQIVYLRDMGVSAPVLQAMVEHGSTQAGGVTDDFSGSAESAAGGNATGVYAPQSQAQPSGPGGTAPPPPVNGSASSFYDALAPYGSWVDVPGYGWCWQPSVAVANPSWQPYANDGNWLWSDDGWYWNSDYSWGWAPFHYGRWSQYPNYGWLWSPDNIWGPAWVSWRDWDDYCGWAPLPFGACFTAGLGWSFGGIGVGFDFGFGLPWSCFSFVPFGNFCDRDWFHHRLAGREARNAFDHSRVHNNFTVGADHRIINRGVDPSRIAAASHAPVRSVAIRDLPRGANGSTMPGRLQRTGNALAVYRPGANLPSVPRNPALASLNTPRTLGGQMRSSTLSHPMNGSVGMSRGTLPASRGNSAPSAGGIAPRTSAAANSAGSRPGATQYWTGPAAQRPTATFRPQSPTPTIRSAPAPTSRPNATLRSTSAWSTPRPSYSAPAYGSRSAPSWSVPRSTYSRPSYSGRSFSSPSFSSRPSASFGGGSRPAFSSGGGRSFGGGGGRGVGRR